MNEKAERINGWDCYAWRHRSNGIICSNRTTDSRHLVIDMLVLALSLLGGFILMSVLSDVDVDDDDDFGGGMMIPATVPSP